MKNDSLFACIRRFTLAAALLMGATWCSNLEADGNPNRFEPVATYTVSGEVAEIATATPDGTILIYTDSESEEVGFVDISDPADPTEIGTIEVAGEPTSVGVTPNGRHALVVVRGDPDHLAVIDLDRVWAEPVVHTLGGQPDSIAISPDGRYAAIAIENERDEDVDDGEMPQAPAGFLMILDLHGAPARWTQRTVSLMCLAERFPSDPEPEFVDINASNQAAVTLQENNHVVIVDLPTGQILDHFSAGTVTHAADLDDDDDEIIFEDVLEDARREPDAIHWTPEGNLVVANEGDYDLDVDLVGGRGFTIFRPAGEIIFDVGADLELELAAAGLYDDGSSDARGSEPEGIEIGTYDDTYLFVGMERTEPGAVAVYRLDEDSTPLFLQILETGERPEGLLALPRQGLFVSADEADGTISIFGLR